jgi:TetR/AcrR family transcriptional regulator, lmrAB and yxaGH operons repressor
VQARAFDSWVAVLARALRSHGHEPAAASRTARHVVAAMEGALLLARARRSTEPLRETAELLGPLVATRGA